MMITGAFLASAAPFAHLLPEIKRSGMTPVASVTISRLFSDFEVLGNFLAHLGFKLATFSYPLTNLQFFLFELCRTRNA